MRRFWDGTLSYFASLFTLAVCGIPSWFTFQAIQAGIAPVWVYAPLVGLVGIGIVLGLAFARKGTQGIAPSRQRRR